MLVGIAVVKHPSLHQIDIKGFKIIRTDLYRSHAIARSGMVEVDGGGIVERVTRYMGGFGHILDAGDIEECLTDGFKLSIPNLLGSFQAHHLLSREPLVPGLHVFHLTADDQGTDDKERRYGKLYHDQCISKTCASCAFGVISL